MYQKHTTLLEVRNTGMYDTSIDSTLEVQAERRSDIIPREETRAVQDELSQRCRIIRRLKCSLGKCYCSCHSSSTRSGRLWTVKFPYDWNACDKSTCHNYKRASFWLSLTSIGIPYAIRAGLDILWTINQSYIIPSLQVTRVVDINAPAFALMYNIK